MFFLKVLFLDKKDQKSRLSEKWAKNTVAAARQRNSQVTGFIFLIYVCSNSAGSFVQCAKDLFT
jgi:hypothetical protein